MSDTTNPAAPETAAPPAAAPVSAPVETPAAPAAPIAAYDTPSAAPVTAAQVEPARKKRRAIGVAALVFAILAVLTDIITLAFGFGSISQFSDGNIGRGSVLLAGFIGFGLTGVLVGAIFAGVAFVLSIGALIGGSGRVAGVIALLVSLAVLVLHGIAIAAIIGAVSAVGGLIEGVGSSIPGLDQLIPGLGLIPGLAS